MLNFAICWMIIGVIACGCILFWGFVQKGIKKSEAENMAKIVDDMMEKQKRQLESFESNLTN